MAFITQILCFLTALAAPFSAVSHSGNAVPLENHVQPYCLHDETEDVDYRDDINVRIDYASLAKPRLEKAVFSEEIFFKPATTYHHLLARQSIGLALTAFTLYDVEDETGIFGTGTLLDYIVQTKMDTIRFDDYEKETSLYTIGSAMAHKEISYNGEKADLILVAIRGGNYNNEWQSNFTLGYGGRHEGFDYAAGLVTDRFYSYWSQLKPTHPVKIWITGFSRAGAVANLVGANLNERGLFDADSVFTYTFAAPAAHDETFGYKADQYQNIFNVIGASDFIPQFVPRQWGFRRYGTDRMLMGSEFDSTFDFKYKSIQKHIEAHGGKTYYVPEFNFRLRMLYGLLEELSSDKYGFIHLLEPVFLSILQDSSANSILELLRSTLIRFDAFDNVSNEQRDTLINYVLAFIQPLFTGTGFMTGQQSTATATALLIAHEHFPELYFHTLYDYGEKDAFSPVHNFAYAILEGGEYILSDQDIGQELVRVKDGAKTLSAYSLENNLNYTTFVEGGKTILVVPYDRHYELRYSLQPGQSLKSTLVPYNQYFVSSLHKYVTTVDASGPREGSILSVTASTTAYSGIASATSPDELNRYLNIDMLGIPYYWYIVIIALIFALVLIAVLIGSSAIYAKVTHAKMSPFRLILLSLIILFAFEGEILFWFSANLTGWILGFKIAAAICMLILYFIGKKPADFKRIDKTILPGLLLLISANVIASVNVIACISLAIAGAGYFCFYNLRKHKLSPHLWIIFGVTILLGTPLLILFLELPSVESILYLCAFPAMALMVFTGFGHTGTRSMASGFWVAGMGMLGVYLFSAHTAFLGSVLYVVFINIALVVTALHYEADPIPALPPRENGTPALSEADGKQN